ncbi:hypothetical protein BD847_1931 [Flavobacterium cutihirudinis]|uniref:Lipoprotein n=1 Tax=Flavobacterium cutihirudinis TaxID=1265740 RepID=A0A3D9FWR0_9FLAO|nr:DUF6252 family protein [Flavobacterium cutihirudinis]RED25186.1 hypothetical protein BD847_1931 [Flavobacterium cutihirudinis]
MKKIVCFLALLFLSISCTEDIMSNNSVFQGLKDNTFWRSTNFTAHLIENGNVIIESYVGTEKVVLQIASVTPQTYLLGKDSVSSAYYTNDFLAQKVQYSTNTEKGIGQIVITEYNTETNTVSGTFKFTAINEDSTEGETTKTSFTEGVFYKIPISSNE